MLVERLYMYSFKPVYLIFDQFEEIFTLGEPEEQREFFQFLADIHASTLQIKIVLSLREEYLAYFSDFEHIVPYIFYHRMRVEKMQFQALHEVISGTLQANHIDFQAEVPERIIQNLSTAKRQGVDLPYLQVYLDKLYQHSYQNSGAAKPSFTLALVEEVGKLQDIMEDFVSNQIIEIENKTYNQELAWQVLKTLITSEGTKKPVNFQEILEALEE